VLIAAGLGGFGVLRMGSRNALQKVYSDVRQLLPPTEGKQGGDKADGDTEVVSPPE
jgi:hypothetical protein